MRQETAGGASPSPTVLKKLFRDWVGEALGPPAVDDSGQKVTLIRLAYARHLPPYRGKAFGRLIAAPTAYPALGAFARSNQARKWNRTSRNFSPHQAPVGRIELRNATQILRAGNIAKPNKYASPVMGF